MLLLGGELFSQFCFSLISSVLEIETKIKQWGEIYRSDSLVSFAFQFLKDMSLIFIENGGDQSTLLIRSSGFQDRKRAEDS